MTAIQREQIQAVEMRHPAYLHVENHANTDYNDIEPREPRIFTLPFDTFKEAVALAAKIHSIKERGENYICDIAVVSGPRVGRYHVSQNGRVWEGLARDNFGDAVEVKL